MHSRARVLDARDTARTMSRENVEAVRGSIEAYRRGDYAAASAYLAPDVVWEVGQEGPARGPAAVQEAWKRWDSEWQELEMVAEELIAVGDNVVVAMRYRGRGRASGAEVVDQLFEVHRFRRRQCVHKTDYRQRSDALEAAGLTEAGSPRRDP
jgi:ketosteroid isomerase-like protein